MSDLDHMSDVESKTNQPNADVGPNLEGLQLKNILYCLTVNPKPNVLLNTIEPTTSLKLNSLY